MTCAYDEPVHAVASRRMAHVEEWRGPDGHTLLSWKVNFGAGGTSRLRVRSREGHEHVLEGVQLEIVEPERVVFRAGAPVEDLPERQQIFTFRRA